LKNTIYLICFLIPTLITISADVPLWPPPPPPTHFGSIRIGMGLSDSKTGSRSYDSGFIGKIGLQYHYRPHYYPKRLYEITSGFEYINHNIFFESNQTEQRINVQRFCLPLYFDWFIDESKISLGIGPFISYSIKNSSQPSESNKIHSHPDGFDFGMSARIRYMHSASWVYGYEYRYGEIYDNINFDTHCLTLAYQFQLRDVFETKPTGDQPL